MALQEESTRATKTMVPYVLVFPNGDDPGWHYELVRPQDPTENISAMEYYSYRLMVRPTSQHLLHLFDNLFQQFIVDYVRKD